jgi:hypothetical protein
LDRDARRRLGRWVLGGLLAVHLLAFWLYGIHAQQFEFLGHWRDGREAYGQGRNDEAAASLRRFAVGYRDATRPFLLRPDFPREANAWGALGRVETTRGALAAARDAYLEAEALGLDGAGRELHDLLWALGDAPGLEARGARQLARDPADLQGHLDLAAAALLGGDTGTAGRRFEAALPHVRGWLAAHGRAAEADGRLADEEANLRTLAGAAAVLAGEVSRAEALCAPVTARQDPEQPQDGLCVAALAAARGDRAAVQAALDRMALASPEQHALARALLDRTDAAREPEVPSRPTPR